MRGQVPGSREMQKGGDEMSHAFRDLIAWQKAYELAWEIYDMTKYFPKNEQHGLVSQIRRSAMSVIGNIAEGYERKYRKEYVRFLLMAKGSLGELETYLMFSRDFKYITSLRYERIEGKRKEVARILTGLIKAL